MQMSRFIYICRKWNKDETRLGQLLTYLGKYSSSDPYQMVIFPEGTNLTLETQKKSAKYGEENNLKPLPSIRRGDTDMSCLGARHAVGG